MSQIVLECFLKFVFDAFVKIRVMELDVYSSYKRVIVVLFSPLSHRDVEEVGWFNNKVIGLFLSSHVSCPSALEQD